jgi:AAHS family 4-hydroxybenzoate transporter-like MFS transporter
MKTGLALGLETLVDEQQFGRFNLALLCLSFLAMLSDGFDIAALASAAPALARDWHVLPKSFGPALSASLFGILIGAPVLGYLGDRRGRRPAVVLGSLIFGLGTLATVATQSIGQMTVLRFLTGIGIGGLMPNLIALSSELQPKRWRATMVVLMFTGITAGSSLPGFVQAWLIPEYGWHVMFLIGGSVPLLVAVLLHFKLPESVKYLSLRPDQRPQLLATLRRLRPDLGIADDAEILSPAAVEVPGTGLRQIFGNGLAWITPLLWLCFAMTLMTQFFMVSWLPLILETDGLAPREAGIATSLYHIGGTVGGVIVSLLLSRYGFAVIAVLFVGAIPAMAAVGTANLPFVALAAITALSGFFVLGSQFGNNAASGLLYPTAYRSRGVGWALAIGRFGSVAGPLVGASLIAAKMPAQKLFTIASLPMVVGAVAAGVLALLCYRRFRGPSLDDSAVRVEPG